MEWSQNLVLLLLDEYQKREILWKPRHPLFYNTIKKEDAWQEVAEIVNVEVQEIKKKIESLKGSFRREKSRVKKGTGTGKGRDQIYVSRWFAYEHMKFLEDRDDPNKTLNNAGDEIEIEDKVDDNTEQQEQIAGDADASQNLNENIESSSDGESLTQVTPKKLFKSPQKRPWAKTKVKEDPRLTEAFNYLKKKTETADRPKDDCQLFGEYVGKKLRQLEGKLRATVQHRIGNILYELEMEQYNFPTVQQEYRPSQQISFCNPLSRSSTPLSTASSSIQQSLSPQGTTLTEYLQNFSDTDEGSTLLNL